MPMSTAPIRLSDHLHGRTLGNDILHRLREDIVSCVFKPGERLRFETLREVYGASFSTLREALSHLTSEGLVVSQGQRGYRVAPVSLEDLRDLTEARVFLERHLLGLAMERGGEPWRVSVLSAYHRLSRTEARGDSEVLGQEWVDEHRAFHEALVSACGSPILLQMRATLFDRAHRYRRLSTRLRTGGRDKMQEHRRLMEAALGGDVALAQDLVEAHFRSTTNYVMENISEIVLAADNDA